MKKDIIVLGDVVNELLLEAQHEKGTSDSFIITDLKERIGGDALDICVICSRIGLSTSLVSSIGLDASTLLDKLDKEKIDYSHLVVCDEKTGKIVKINADNSLATLSYPGACSHIYDYGIDEKFLSAVKLLHISTYELKLKDKFENPFDFTISSQYTQKYSLDSYPEWIDILFMSPTDAMKLTKEDECESAVKELASLDSRQIIVPDRGRCAYILENGDYKSVNMVPTMSYDASMYYSSFIGAFLSRYVKTKNVNSSVSFGLSYQHFAYVDNKHFIKREQKEVEDVMHRIVRTGI